MKLRWFAFLIVLLAGCSTKHDYQNPPWNPEVPVKRAMQWMPISEQAGKAWGVSPRLITAIIAVESGGNPTLVSKSNAVGLMQLKASTAGREVCIFQRGSGDVWFTTNVRGQVIAYGQNTGACFVSDGSLWLQTSGY